MRYQQMQPAVFLDRPNRFVAHVDVKGQTVVCHVKNTGRCRELLVPGCRVWVQYAPSPARKTAYDLIAVEKGERLINMDAAAPNRAFWEYVRQGRFLQSWPLVQPEKTHGDSRFDFYGEGAFGRLLVEVKGCTLEEDGLARFPDAPTLRGLKHVQELTALAAQGWHCAVLIVIQMKGVHTFAPNWSTQPAFGWALAAAEAAGVRLIAMDCRVAPE